MILFYDTETTGVDWKKNSIIQLSGVLDKNGEVLEEFDFKVRPHPKAKIEESALQANGHDKFHIMLYPDMREVLQDLITLLKKYIDPYDPKNKIHLCGFRNSGFDDNFLRMFFVLCNNKSFGSYFWSDSIDVSCMASDYLREIRHTMPSFKLHRVARTLGLKVDKDKLHNSMYDTRLTRAVYYRIKNDDLLS